MCNPDDQTPVVDGAAGEQAVTRDSRSNAQRLHDGLNAALRSVLASEELGQHNGLPATIIVSTTLQDLEQGAGTARTGGGSLLPMADVIRLARHAYHYLTSASMKVSRSGCITPNDWPHPDNESSSTPRTADAPAPAATSADIGARSTTSTAGQPPDAPTSTPSRWPADPTTNSKTTAGPPAKTPRAKPNGYHRRTWITVSHAPTASTIRRSSSAKTTQDDP